MKQNVWRWIVRGSFAGGLLLQTTTTGCNLQDTGNLLRKVLSIGFLLGVGT